MLTAEQVALEAAATGFRAEAFEKAARLHDVLAALRSHPFLKSRIALKGGTALNLFVLDVPRLSVDIDLNVVGAVERETMLSERPKVEQALGAVCSRLGLQVRRAPGGHAGGKWRLAYSSSFGRRDWRRVSLADVTADPVDREGYTKYRRRSRRQRSSSASASASAGGSAVTGERSLPFLHEQGAPEVDETHLTRSASAAPQSARSKELRTGSAILAIRGTCSEMSASSSMKQRCTSRRTCSPMAPHGDRLRVHSRFRSVRQRGLGA